MRKKGYIYIYMPQLVPFFYINHLIVAFICLVVKREYNLVNMPIYKGYKI